MMKSKNMFDVVDISTRPKRRRAVSLIVTELTRIREAEEAYLNRIPENMEGGDAYAAADESIDLLIEAIDFLTDAY